MDFSCFVLCDGCVYFVVGGMFWCVVFLGGFGVVVVDVWMCVLLWIGNDMVLFFFVNGVGDSVIYMVMGGVFCYVVNFVMLMVLNGFGVVCVVILVVVDMVV